MNSFLLEPVWIGAVRDEAGGSWVWVGNRGRPGGSLWSSGKPTGAAGKDCGALDGALDGALMLHDETCTKTFAFLCSHLGRSLK